ncbi:hypothetical protein ERO13_A10G008200v2 [Gossypium hirsutum]|uniref:Uncharacterized protein isoform X1 n=1 Tax=Gossypium hirsutum TaxID=3635 RepID=A0A1U8LDR4_GOSHI|nr:uncharacterized protein LOC107925204 isoform X1 [Gossypium hirsutum]KAG4177916.1 hypothetical protein ERO13_A10G008200v2 [Gossypium hirsutum]
MGDSFPLFNDCDPAVLSTLKQYLSQPNNNDEDNGDGYATFCFHYKGAILRSIEQRTGNSTVPDAVLDSLILIENLDRRRGFLPSESMKAAFCAVAVHCTVSCLPVSWDNYFDAFHRIWGLRIKSLEESGKSDLISSELVQWGTVIEAGLWDLETSQRLSSVNTRGKALLRIKGYLEEAFRSMNPALSQLASASTTEPTVDHVASANPHPSTDEGNMDNVVSASAQVPSSPHPCIDERNMDNVVYSSAQVPSSPHPCSDEGNISPSPHPCADKGNVDNVTSAAAQVPSSPHPCTNKKNKIRRASFQARHKPRPRCKQRRGVVITDMEEDQPLCIKNGTPSSFEVNGCLQVSSKTRSAALLDGVTDSPFEALEVVETVASVMAGKNFCPKGSMEDSNKDKGDPTASFYPTTHHCTDKGKQIQMVNSQTSGNPNSSHRHCEEPAAIADTEEDRVLSTPNIDKLRDALTSSVADLTASVTDPLPKALEVAERLVSFMEAAKSSSAEGAEGDVRKEKGVPAASMNCNFERAQADRREPDKAIREDQDKMNRSVPADLTATVADSLPKALEVAERLVSFMAAAKSLSTEGAEGDVRKEKGVPAAPMNCNFEQAQAERRAPDKAIREDQDKMGRSVPASSVGHGVQPSQATEGNETFIRPKKVPKRNLMKRNDAAHTHERRAPYEGIREDYNKVDGSVPAPSVNHIAEPSHAKEGNEAVIRPKKVRKRSIMERNDTAHTSEWEDSIDGSDGGTSGCSNRCTLPSPKTNHVSPLKESEPQKQKNRRKTNWWTLEEEQALIKGYRVYGPQWKLIRESYWDILKKRTQVDLKDKWRNLSK